MSADITPEYAAHAIRKVYRALRLGCNMGGLNLNIAGQERTDKTLSHPIRYYFALFCTVLMTISLFIFCCQYYMELDRVAKAFTLLVQLILAINKSLTLIMRGRSYMGIIEQLNEMAVAGNAQCRQIWLNENRRLGLLADTYYGLSGISAILYFFTGIMITIVQHARGNKVFATVYDGLYPYHCDNVYVYLFGLLWFFTAAIGLIIPAVLGLDTIFYSFVFNISAHFRILQQKLSIIAAQLAANRNNLAPDYAQFERSVIELVVYHRRIIASLAEFQRTFSYVMFLEISASCLKLCFIVYQLIYISDWSTAIVMVPAFLTISVQLMIYCFCGEKIRNEAEDFAIALYLLLPWERMSPKMRRLMLLPLARVQKQTNITGFIFVADRNLMVWIFKTAGSVISVLLAVNK